MNVSNVSSVQSLAQEATETLAQTKAEAAKGDQQAARKLAAQQGAAGTQAPSQPVDVDSDKGKLDAKA